MKNNMCSLASVSAFEILGANYIFLPFANYFNFYNICDIINITPNLSIAHWILVR